MKVLYDIQDLMEDELKSLSKKEQLTKEDVCLIGEMVDIVKDIVTVEAMKESTEQGGSYARSYGDDYAYANSYRRSYEGRSRDDGYSEAGSYARGRGSYENSRESYDGSRDSSYARGRDSMGRFTSRDEGYSRHTKDEMIKNLEQMMMNARTPEERENYRATIEQMSK